MVGREMRCHALALGPGLYATRNREGRGHGNSETSPVTEYQRLWELVQDKDGVRKRVKFT